MFDKIKDIASNFGQGQDLGDLASNLGADERVTDMASNFGQYSELFQGLDFPASKDDLLAQLQEHGADSGLLGQVASTHQDQFNGVDDILNAIRNR